jgi:type I restriction enzyme M protein
LQEWWINKSYEDLLWSDSETLEILKALKIEAIDDLGYFLYPQELFSYIAKKWNSTSSKESDNIILEDLTKILKNIESSTMW